MGMHGQHICQSQEGSSLASLLHVRANSPRCDEDAGVALNTVHALTGWVHPNINLDDPEGDVELEILVGPQKQQVRSRRVLLILPLTFARPCF